MHFKELQKQYKLYENINPYKPVLNILMQCHLCDYNHTIHFYANVQILSFYGVKLNVINKTNRIPVHKNPLFIQLNLYAYGSLPQVSSKKKEKKIEEKINPLQNLI